MHHNIGGGICNKKENLEKIFEDHGVDIVCISEHHLNQDVQHLCIDDFIVINFFARSYNQKGGVCILAKNSLNITKSSFNNSEEMTFEMCAVNCRISENNFVTICTVYRSPKSNFKAFLSKLAAMIELMYNSRYDHIICGDFNVDLLKDSRESLDLQNLFLEYNLKASIIEPTRITLKSKTCIDNFYVDFAILGVSVYDSFISDHTYQVLTIQKETVNCSIPTQLYRPINSNNIKIFRNAIGLINWHTLLVDRLEYDVDIIFDRFYREFKDVFEQCFPLCKTPRRNKKPSKKWFTPELRNLSKVLQEMCEISKQIDDHRYNTRYKELKSYYNLALKFAKKTFNNKRILESNNINKESWRIVAENRGKQNRKKIELEHNNKKINDPTEIGDAFNNYFASFSNSDNRFINVPLNVPMQNKTLFLHPCEPLEVQQLISKMCKKQSCGIDNIPGNVLISVKDLISPILSFIINLSFSQGKYPDALKISKIIPIFKNKGSALLIENYRPVALQSHFAKIFECCLNKRLSSYLEKYKILTQHQHGFRSKLSTSTALDAALQHVYEGLNNKETVLGLFFDMSKAFDTVDHELLVTKLDLMGIRGTTNSWIRSYLLNRTQQVVVDGVKSAAQTIKKGLPQGSCISPTLFNCYINDLAANLIPNANSILYADDTNIIISDRSYTNTLLKAQQSIDNVAMWMKSNGIQLNKQKSAAIKFVPKNTHVDTSVLLKVERKSIENVDATKFLGVYLDHKLTWNYHINYILPKLSSCSFLIQNIRNTVSIDVLKLVYFGLFQSIITYGIIYWGLAAGAERIFAAQKNAIRRITQSSHLAPCRDLFKKLKILTFPSLYIYSLLIYIKKDLTKWQTRSNIHSYETRNKKLYNVPYSRLSIGQTNPQYTGLQLYNHAIKVYKCFEENDNLNVFKSKIKMFLLNKCFYSVDDFFK